MKQEGVRGQLAQISLMASGYSTILLLGTQAESFLLHRRPTKQKIADASYNPFILGMIFASAIRTLSVDLRSEVVFQLSCALSVESGRAFSESRKILAIDLQYEGGHVGVGG